MKLFLVLPTYNRKDALRRVLMQISNLSYSPEVFLKTCVVIAGSTDGTAEMITNDFPETIIVLGNSNWWYTHSMNEGFRYVEQFTPDYVLTLNDDVEFQPNYLQNLIIAAKEKGNQCIINSVSVNKSNHNQVVFSGVYKINKFLRKYYSYFPPLTELPFGTLKGIHPTLILSGRGILIPFNILKDLNYFDEIFPQYGSDDDFGLRAIKKGYKLFVSWDAQIFENTKLTSKGTAFNKPHFGEFVSSFFNKYSINSLRKTFIYSWRHGYKILLPLYIIFALAGTIKAWAFKYK